MISPQLMVGLVIVFFVFVWFCRSRRKFNRHRVNVAKARRTLKRLQGFENPAQQMSYLRKVDPYVFEEMILTAIAEAGGRIERNARYSGDGGIDGKAIINGRKTLIQAKRYKGHICAQHVKDFSNLCARRRRQGLFVHTGRTGRLARSLQDGTVEIIGGEKLLTLLGVRGQEAEA